MLKIRQANKNDEQKIIGILKQLDLYYPTLTLDNFWLAEKNKKILGVVQLKEYHDFLFLGSLATIKKERGKAIASTLLNNLLKNTKMNIYLYTIIPEFFRKFGFEITKPLPSLPSRDQYECEYCHADKCVCMVKSFS